MIDEPIRLIAGQNQFKKLCSENVGGTVFVIETTDRTNWFSYVKILDTKGNREIAATGNKSWYDVNHLLRLEIEPRMKPWYMVNNLEVSKAKFFEIAMSHYPDHFEWLLFHPEFLV